MNQNGGDAIDPDANDALSPEELQHAIQQYNEESQRLDVGPSEDQLIGSFTIICFVMNRTIGSGIFETPPKVLSGIGSVGGALITWFSAGLIALCGTMCWLELGMTIPMHLVPGFGRQSTPRSGGEKNYLEYIFKRPRLLMTCVFGILFILLGNLAGNAISFGINVMIAAGRDPINNPSNNHEKASVIALAITILTVCPIIHMLSRKGGILINNGFAVLKVGILLAIIILGWAHAAGSIKSKEIDEPPMGKVLNSTQNCSMNITSELIDSASHDNFKLSTSFSGSNSVASVVQSLIYAIYPYTGFEQPFYVLSEVRRPRRIFPFATISAMVITIVLYILVNTSYFLVVPAETYTSCHSNTIDMAGTFFHYLFDETRGIQTGRRTMAALKAFSIFGNILVLTYTAARVKQEIAKEGILPWSLFFAEGRTTPLARYFSRAGATQAFRRGGDVNWDHHLEQSPMAALLLHWFTSILMVAVTSMMTPQAQYGFLVGLYTYSIVAVLGVLTAGGLLYLKIDSLLWPGTGRNWSRNCAWPPRDTWKRKISGVYAAIYFFSMAFVLFASFAPQSDKSPFSASVLGYNPYWVNGIGLASVLWGVIWWLGLELRQWKGQWRLEVKRTPYIEPDRSGGFVQRLEIVEHEKVFEPGFRMRVQNFH